MCGWSGIIDRKSCAKMLLRIGKRLCVQKRKTKIRLRRKVLGLKLHRLCERHCSLIRLAKFEICGAKIHLRYAEVREDRNSAVELLDGLLGISSPGRFGSFLVKRYGLFWHPGEHDGIRIAAFWNQVQIK